MRNSVQDAIMGLVVGDALGVPVEFISRAELLKNPVKDMLSYGTYNKPKGTWSDDSSLTLCLAQSLTDGCNYKDIMNKFSDWLNKGYMTATEEVFDVGRTTSIAIAKYLKGGYPTSCGGTNESDNGNGSLMRILPIAFYLKNMVTDYQFKVIHDISSFTHAHPRSLIACGIYVQIAIELMDCKNKEQSIKKA